MQGVLAYHKVGTPELGGTWCTRAQLRGHLGALRQAGWQAVDLQTFAAGIAAPPSGSAKRVLLSFDDAFASFADAALPVLQAAAMPSVVFVVSDFVGRRSTWDLHLPGRHVAHCDWPALRDLVRAGVTIGSHAATHADLRRLDDAALAHELSDSRCALEDGLGIAVRSIAYPFGSQDARVRAAAGAAGYELGFTIGVPADGRDPLALPRHGVYVIDGPGAVLDKLDPSRPGHAWQLLAGRAIHACATVAARGSGRLV
jgi:peptidoglycan/xylan/chitin deacetylase (PgdA/CDA1 family)